MGVLAVVLAVLADIGSAAALVVALRRRRVRRPPTGYDLTERRVRQPGLGQHRSD